MSEAPSSPGPSGNPYAPTVLNKGEDVAKRSKQPDKSPPHEVVFFAYPKLIYAWPLIVAGLGFYFLAWGWESAFSTESYESLSGFLGWAYLFTTLITLTTMAIDLERNYAFVWALIFGLFFFGGLALSSWTNIPIFDKIFDFFYRLGAKYDPGYGLALSILLLFPYAVMLIWVRINHRWRITHNEFEQYSWGRADDSLARGAKRVRSTYPDLLEFLLCGAGTLIVYSATGRSELRRIPNVPFLFRVRKKINALLETQQVTLRDQDMLAEAESEAEEYESDSAEDGERRGDDLSRGGAEGIGGNDPL